MPRPCSICVHEKRAEIEAAIVRGESFRSISYAFRVSPHAVSRHKKSGHIEFGGEIVEVHKVEVVERVESVWNEIAFWSTEIKEIYRKAKAKNETTIQLSAFEKSLKLIALTAQLKAMAVEGAPGDGKCDPVAGAHLIMQYLHKHATKEVCDGLVEYLREQYRLYGPAMIPKHGM
jgi:hypothetical protein